MDRVLASLLYEHTPAGLCLAAAFCAAGAAAFFFALTRIAEAEPTRRDFWRLAAGLVVGGGFWTAQMTALLFYEPPGVIIRFAPGFPFAALVLSVIGGWLAVRVYEARRLGRLRLPLAGAAWGVALCAVHVIGVEGLRLGAEASWRWDLAFAAWVLCVLGCAGAFAVYGAWRGPAGLAGAALLSALALLALHVLSMAAQTLTPAPDLAYAGPSIARAYIPTLAATGLASVVSMVSLLAFAHQRLTRVLKQEAARFARLADAAIEGIVIHDRSRIVDVNSRFEAMVARPLADLRGAEIRQFFKDETWAEFQASLTQAGESVLERQINLHGAPVWVEIHTRALSREENLWISSVRDISARRRAEQAEAANAAKTQFVANMSHELRTPLNAIIGYAEMLEEEGHDRGDAIVAQDAGRIIASARHLLTLINELLDLAKIEAGKLEIEFAPVGAAATARDVAATVRPLVEANGNRFELVVDGDPGDVNADAFRLKQCLLNLASNAAKFTKNGRVGIRVRRIGEIVEFAVADSGIGMTPAQVAQLFRPFEQADASVTRKFGGTGLGLAITKRLMELMGGQVRVRSALGRGSVFTLSLPAAQARRIAA